VCNNLQVPVYVIMYMYIFFTYGGPPWVNIESVPIDIHVVNTNYIEEKGNYTLSDIHVTNSCRSEFVHRNVKEFKD